MSSSNDIVFHASGTTIMVYLRVEMVKKKFLELIFKLFTHMSNTKLKNQVLST